MTILISDWASFDQVLPLAKKYGVGLEIQEFTQPEYLDNPDQLIASITKLVKGTPLLSMHGPFAELVPASWDPLVRQVVARRFAQAHAIAQRISARHLILHSGFVPKTYSIERWTENTRNFWMDFLKDKSEPDFFHIENVYEDDFNPLKEFIDRVNESLGKEILSINLDIGHVNANSSHSLGEWIGGLGDRIRYTHLHNNGGSLDDHWRLDHGTIEVSQVLDLLQAHAPHANWSVETTVGDIEPSLEWLKNRGYL